MRTQVKQEEKDKTLESFIETLGTMLREVRTYMSNSRDVSKVYLLKGPTFRL